MICVVIKGPSFQEAYQQISEALKFADLIELRLDLFRSLDLDALKDLRAHFSIPMIFTLRSQRQGGRYLQTEQNRLTAIRRIVELKPEYLDLENHISTPFIQEISALHPEVKLIFSYHNFEETPKNLDEIFREMQKIPAFFYKIAVTANNCLDALKLISWAKKTDDQLIAISMGYHGQISRILGPIVNSPITYAVLEDSQVLAPGQLTAKTLIEQYHHNSLNEQTILFGLIGDPVDLSISDITHNNLIESCGLNAVYVKIKVIPAELSEFLELAKEFPFHGLSVTMPLKEHIIPFLDEIDSQAINIGAVNTLFFQKGKIIGFNTDGIGALNAIEEKYLVKDKQIVIIGAGGATKAIAYEAIRRGGKVTILNRDEEKSSQIGQRLDCRGKGLDYIATCSETGYDMLINCTPSPLPIHSDYILPQAIVMDITTNPRETLFLKLAKEKGCPIIYGYRMFVEQAVGQFNLWLNSQLNIYEIRTILEKKTIDCLSRVVDTPTVSEVIIY